MFKLTRFFLLVLGVVTFLAPAVQAFGVMPMEVNLQSPRPGSRITSDLEAYNGDSMPLHISSRVMDWTLTREGRYEFSEGGTSERSCAKWIQLNPPEFVLAPKQSVRVRFTVTTPENFDRDHWAMLFFESRPVPLKGAQMGVTVSARVGCKLVVSPAKAAPNRLQIADMDLKNLQNVAQIAPVAIESPSQSAPGAKAKVSVQNLGENLVRINGTIEIHDAGGKIIAKGALLTPKANVLPGLTRELWLDLAKPLLPGVYHVAAAIECGAAEMLTGELKITVTALPVAVANGS